MGYFEDEIKAINYGIIGLLIGAVIGIFASNTSDVTVTSYESKPKRKERFEDTYVSVPVLSSIWPDIVKDRITCKYVTFREGIALRHKLTVYYKGFNHEVIADTKEDAIDSMSFLLS